MSTDERDPAQVRMDDLREQAREWFEADVREFRRSWVQNGTRRATPHAAGGDVTGPTTEETRDAR